MTTEKQGTSVGTVLIGFLVGVVGGIIGALVVPGLVRPYLPASMVGTDELVHGVVTGKRMETDRLLLTLPTPGGTVLATFTDDISEIDLMVTIGDSITFGMDEYQPFVTNPEISRVVTLSSPLANPRVPDSIRMDSATVIDTMVAPESAAPMDSTRADSASDSG